MAMSREIQRQTTCLDNEESKAFGGPYWGEWKYSLLDYLKIDNFPDERTENVLHSWWCLRMKLKLGILTREEFDKERNVLFPPDDDSLESNKILLEGVRYITNRTTKMDGDIKIKKI